MATHTCKCDSALYCSSCLGQHISNSPSPTHIILAIDDEYQDLIRKVSRSCDDIMDSYSKHQQFEERRKELIDRFEALRSEANRRGADIINHIESPTLYQALVEMINSQITTKKQYVQNHLSMLNARIDDDIMKVKHLQFDNFEGTDDEMYELLTNLHKYKGEQFTKVLDWQFKVDVSKLRKDLDDLFAIELKSNFAELEQSQGTLVKPIPNSSRLNLYDLRTNTKREVEVNCISFYDTPKVLLLPDNTVCVIGTSNSGGMIQRINFDTLEVVQYLPNRDDTRFDSYVRLGNAIYGFDTGSCDYLDLKSKVWTNFGNLDEYGEKSAAAHEGSIFIKTSKYYYKVSTSPLYWERLKFTSSIPLFSISASIDHCLFCFKKNEGFIQSGDQIERFSMELPELCLSTVNKYKGEIYFMTTNSSTSEVSVRGWSILKRRLRTVRFS